MQQVYDIPYHQVYSDKELELKYLNEVLESGATSGNQGQCQKVIEKLKSDFSYKEVLLLPSATSALEMMALLLEIAPGDEVIMPSFTFVSTANAFALRGAKIVFVDIEEDTLNLCPLSLEEAITSATKACVVIHYGGVAAKLNEIQSICQKNNVILLEDSAQCIGSQYKGTYLGNFGELSCLSFHQSKNVQCGEGGALIINSEKYTKRARIIQEKGTNRFEFKEGRVNKYHWLDLGSSYLMPELSAAYLRAQLSHWEEQQEIRQKNWHQYYEAFLNLQKLGHCRLVNLPKDVEVNGHVFYLLLNSQDERESFVAYMKTQSIQVATHYEALHLTKFGIKLTQTVGDLKHTEKVVSRLVRLPTYPMSKESSARVIKAVNSYFS